MWEHEHFWLSLWFCFFNNSFSVMSFFLCLYFRLMMAQVFWEYNLFHFALLLFTFVHSDPSFPGIPLNRFQVLFLPYTRAQNTQISAYPAHMHSPLLAAQYMQETHGARMRKWIWKNGWIKKQSSPTRRKVPIAVLITVFLQFHIEFLCQVWLEWEVGRILL